MESPFDLITIIGPTATGKTSLAVAVGRCLDAELISADSRQVFRGMDIGTGKDLDEYILPDGRVIPYHLIDIKNPGDPYSVYHYANDFEEAINGIRSRERMPLLVGGTGMYVEHVLKGQTLQEVPPNEPMRRELESLSREDLLDILRRYPTFSLSGVDLSSKRRIVRAIEVASFREHHTRKASASSRSSLSGPIICLTADRELRWAHIEKRLHERLGAGMVDEVQHLLDEGVSSEVLRAYGLEYRYITDYLLGVTPYDDMVLHLNIAIRQFSKRQMTWFRGMQRRGFEMEMIDASLPMDEKRDRVLRYVESYSASR